MPHKAENYLIQLMMAEQFCDENRMKELVKQCFAGE